MTESFVNEWRRELDLLLHHIAHHPSHDLTEQRARLVVLRQLLAEEKASEVA